MIIVEINWMSTNREKIDYWLDIEDSRKKIDNWLDVEDSSKKIDTIDLLIELSSLITMSWLTFRTKRSTIDCHSRRLTMRQVKVRFNHRSQREDFFLSQIHDHSRWLTMRIVKVRCNHRLQRQNFTLWRFYFDSRTSTSDLTIFFNYSRISTSIFDDLILLTRVSRRAICFKTERLIE